MPCLSYTVHLTLYTLHCTPYTENKKYFLCFFLYLPKGIYLCLFTTSRPRACLIYIHAKPTRRQAIHCAYAYTRVLFNVRAYACMRDTSPGPPTIYNFWGERRQ